MNWKETRAAQREQRMVRIYHLSPTDHEQLLDQARTAGNLVPRPTTSASLTQGTQLNTIRMGDNTTYVVYTDGSFRRIPKRRRFTFEDGRVLSGRQLRSIRKRARREIRAAQAAGTQAAS